MYNLEVAQNHTYTVVTDQWVVHNCGGINEVLQKLQDAGIKWGDNNHFPLSTITLLFRHCPGSMSNHYPEIFV